MDTPHPKEGFCFGEIGKKLSFFNKGCINFEGNCKNKSHSEFPESISVEKIVGKLHVEEFWRNFGKNFKIL